MILTQRVHPFPFRTRKLSSAVPKILIWRRIGKIGHCRHIIRETLKCFPCNRLTQYSSLAQSVEHLTVNQVVAGSSPAGGAKKETKDSFLGFFFVSFIWRRTTCCLPKQTAKVCGSANYIIPQTLSANSGSEPGNLFGSNYR